MPIKLSHAYSLGKQKREAQFIKSKDILGVPGPGQYSPSVKTTKGKINPSWSLSKDQRDKLFSSISPGPGQYRIPSKVTDGPKYHLGLKTEYNRFKNKSGDPGPGRYDPKKPDTQLFYTIVKRNETELSEHKVTPGPGHYLDMRNLYYKNIPGSKMGREMRNSSFLKTPAHDKPSPGTYKTFTFADRKSTPKYGFGTSKREKDYLSSPQLRTLQPGPGNYTMKSTLGDGTPIATMPGRRKDLRPKSGKDAPGAGTYDPEYKVARRSTPNFSLGKQTRDGEVSMFHNSPGVGSYHHKDNLTRSHSASWKIGSQKRPAQLQYVPPTPGPGQYTLSTTLTGPKYPIGARQTKQPRQSPGPGSYNIKHGYTSKLNRAPSFTVGTQQRVTIKQLNYNPGPGIYQTTTAHKNSYLFSGPKYGFGSSQRMPDRKDGQPGPGSYKIPSQVGNVPKYSIPTRDTRYQYV